MARPPIVYLGADHGGFELKEKLRAALAWSYEVVDLGPTERRAGDDYPLPALLVAGAVAADARSGRRSFGILACRTATGVVMAAGKVPGIRAVGAADPAVAARARQDEDANVLGLSGDRLTDRQAVAIARKFLTTAPSRAVRHRRRQAELERLGSVRPEVVGGVFETDRRKAAARLKALAPLVPVHLDVADGSFVPATAFADPASLARLDLPDGAEAHLMAERPADYVRPWKAAGGRRVIAQVEAPGFPAFLAAARKAGLETGASVDLPTAIGHAAKRLTGVRLIQVMGVKAGKSGQVFDSAALDKVVALRKRYPKATLSVDGGVSDRTAPALVAAGADRLVATSFLPTGPAARLTGRLGRLGA